MTQTSASVSDIDLSDIGFWSEPLSYRDECFARLRAQPSPAFYAEPDYTEIGFTPGPGYYALVKHADVVAATKAPRVFRSGLGGSTNIIDMPDEFTQFFGSMISMDNPEHARLRRIVSRAFASRAMERLEPVIEETVRTLIDDIADLNSCDFVATVAAKVPLHVICDLMGVPESERQFVLERSNRILSGYDPETLSDLQNTATQLLTAGGELAVLVQDIARQRREQPADDLISALACANIDGEQLTAEEISSFFILLTLAGNETTRNAIAGGLSLLTENPEQRQLWQSDFETHADTAVEEIVRLTAPIIFMRRKAAYDYEMNGHQYREGDKVLLFYWSANRDESVFADPTRFDITRSPNPHVGFGGGGPHHCLGVHLARSEMKILYRELFRRLPDITAAAEPDRLMGSNFINAIKRLQCQFTPVGMGRA